MNLKVKAKIVDDEGKEHLLHAVAWYDKTKKLIKYQDESFDVSLILSDKLLLRRTNACSNVCFIFDKNKVTKAKYQHKDINFDIIYQVETINLEINDNYLYLKYKLSSDHQEIGTFIYELNWEVSHEFK